MSDNPGTRAVGCTRRDVLKGAAGFAAAGFAAAGAAACSAPGASRGAGPEKPAARRGRLRQSVAAWPYEAHWDLDRLCRVARELGIESVELVGPEAWPTLAKHGLTCAISPCGMPDPPFVKGLNNLRHHEEVIAVTKKTIDACADFGAKTVIAFTGYKWRDPADPTSGEIPPDEGAANCVAGLKELCAYAEKKGVSVAVEILNTRVSDHPMKGHPGYQGDHVDYVADIVRRVGSPSAKILFDVYHVQVMDGDIIRRIRELRDLIGHVHTAGNPGRGEIDATQEIHYRAVFQALADVGYRGFVGHEFIPTRDPRRGLEEACALADL